MPPWENNGHVIHLYFNPHNLLQNIMGFDGLFSITLLIVEHDYSSLGFYPCFPKPLSCMMMHLWLISVFLQQEA